jgi:hypothetical protein
VTFSVVHGRIELVEIAVSQEWIVDQIELPASVLERIAIACSGEIEPFGMPKLVAFEIEVAFSS